MIVGALVALQLAAAARPFVVRDASHVVRVPTVASASGPMLDPERLGAMLPISVRHDSASAYTIEIWGARLQLEAGLPIVRIGDVVRPLAAAPALRGGKLYVPLQLISEVFPSVVPNTRWDADSSQLVIFSMAGPVRAMAQSAGEMSAGERSSRAREPRANDAQLPPLPAKTGRRLVIVDAGHGGVDNGMTGPLGGGPKIYEKNITLAVAMKLGEQLRARGLDVAYTRTTDTLIALDDRGRIANRDGGDLFISVHVNAANPNWKDPGGSRGFETYFLSEAKTEDARRVEQMENAAAQYETGASKDVGDPLSFIVNDMKQNEHLRESSDLADAIQRRLAPVEPGPSRGVKQAGFRVLVTAYMPAVLVEIGFGTNPRDAAFISDPDKQRSLASAIADAAVEYLRRYDRRVSAGAAADRQR